LAKKLSHEVHHHLKEEENKFFQLSGKILSDRQKSSLAGKYRRDLAMCVWEPSKHTFGQSPPRDRRASDFVCCQDGLARTHRLLSTCST